MQLNHHSQKLYTAVFLSDRAFEGDAEQLLGFDGELHGQLVEHLFGIAVDDQSDGILGGDAALVAVEELVLADFGGGSLVFNDGRLNKNLEFPE